MSQRLSQHLRNTSNSKKSYSTRTKYNMSYGTAPLREADLHSSPYEDNYDGQLSHSHHDYGVDTMYDQEVEMLPRKERSSRSFLSDSFMKKHYENFLDPEKKKTDYSSKLRSYKSENGRTSKMALREAQHKEKISRLVNEISQRKSIQSDLDITISKLQSEKESMMECINEGVEERNKLKKMLEEERLLNMTLTKQNESLQRDVTFTNEQLQSIQAAFDELKKKNDGAMKSEEEARKRLAELESLLADKEHEYAELMAIQDELVESIRETKSKADALQNQHKETKSECEALLQQCERKELLIRSLQDELKKSRNKLNDLRNQLTNQMEEREREHNTLVQKLETANLQLKTDLDEEKKKLRTISLIFSNLSLDFEFEKLDFTTADHFESAVTTIREEVKKLRQQIDDQNKKYANLQDVLQKSKEEKNALKQLIEQQQNETESVNKINSELQSEIQALNSKIAELQETINQRAQERAVEKKILHEEIHEQRNKIEELNKQIEAQMQAEKSLREELSKAQSTSTQTINQLQADIAKLQNSLKEEREKVASLTSEKAKFTTELDKQNSIIQDQENTINQLKNDCIKLNEKEKSLNELLDKITRERNRLKESLDEITSERDTLIQEKKQITEARDDLQKQLDARKSDTSLQHKVLLKKIRSYEAQVTEMQELLNKYSAATTQLEQKKRHAEQLAERILNETNAELQSKQRKIADLETQLAIMRKSSQP